MDWRHGDWAIADPYHVLFRLMSAETPNQVVGNFVAVVVLDLIIIIIVICSEMRNTSWHSKT
jgi:hypothetical protein